MKRYYAVTMSNGDIYGIPAHVIADNYANYYATKGEDYLENYDAMLYWFDTNDYEFADWAKKQHGLGRCARTRCSPRITSRTL